MSEVLTELVAKITTDAAGLKSGLSDAENQTEASSKRMQDSLKKVGTVMAASGAVITAALGFMGKAAIDERANVMRLGVALKGVGINYDDVKDSLESVIAATQRKTGIADNDQRDVLGRLILVTKDYNKAISLLPLALDLAAAGQMDASTAATYLSKAYVELENGAEQIGIRLGQTTVNFKNLDEVQKLVGGTAEAIVNPFDVLKATISDLAEEIGSFLIPTIETAVSYINAISTGTQNWIKANSDLIAPLVLSILKLGALLTVIGSIILILPKIVGFVTMLTGLLGPWGWAVLAVAGLIGYLAAELLGLSGVMVGIKEIMADVNKQMFVMRVEQALTREEWAKIKEQGYLTEEQFKHLALALKMTTSELYDQMEASGMLQVTMSSVGNTNIYLAESTDKLTVSTEKLKTSIEKATIASGEQKEVLDAQAESLMSLAQQIMKTRREYEYARSDAGRLGISIKDVTFALYDQGLTMADVGRVLRDMGDDANDVNKVMEAFGLTAQQVKGILESQKDSVEKLGDAYIATSEKVASATKLSFDPSKVATNWPVSGEELAPLANMWQEVVDLRTAGKWEEANVLLPAVNALQSELYGFKNGGIVPGPIGMPQLAMVHGGETVIPANESMGNVVVNFSQPVFFDREDTMNRFVDMIRKGIQRQDRLRFGGAYAGS